MNQWGANMKVNISHKEKTHGLVFKKTLHGVALQVNFSAEELAIIHERKLSRVVLLERDVPADVDKESHSNRGLVRKIATAAVNGIDANHFDLTFGKLIRGKDEYFFNTPIEAKSYAEELKTDTLPLAKAYLEGDKTTGESDSFEL